MKTIYYNGAVYTGTLPLAEAFAVENGRFLFAGTSEAAKALAADNDRLIDLGGRFVCSGFNDSHMHLLNYGMPSIPPFYRSIPKALKTLRTVSVPL